MRTLLAAALLFGLWLSPSTVSAKTDAQTEPTALHLVQKIYLVELGSSDEAARFRLLLEDELSERGFTVVAQPEQADAILSGALSVSSAGAYGGRSDVSVTVRLNSPKGVRLWSINLPKPVTIASALKIRNLKTKEPVQYRAEELAKALRRDWEKSAKAAGVKVGK